MKMKTLADFQICISVPLRNLFLESNFVCEENTRCALAPRNYDRE